MGFFLMFCSHDSPLLYNFSLCCTEVMAPSTESLLTRLLMLEAVPNSSANILATLDIWSLGGMISEIILVPLLNKEDQMWHVSQGGFLIHTYNKNGWLRVSQLVCLMYNTDRQTNNAILVWHLNLHNTLSKLVLFGRDERCYTVMMAAIAKLSSHFIHTHSQKHTFQKLSTWEANTCEPTMMYFG